VLAHDVLQERRPGPGGVFLVATPDGERLGHLHQVPIVRGEQAERRHERDSDGAGQQKRPQRERRRTPEERDHRVAPGAECPIGLNSHDLAAPQRSDQLE
jgi:hypothetical protein